MASLLSAETSLRNFKTFLALVNSFDHSRSSACLFMRRRSGTGYEFLVAASRELERIADRLACPALPGVFGAARVREDYN